VFSLNTFVGSDFDGLSEDAAGPAKCNAPVVQLAIQKTAQNPTVCPGDKDRFTVTVTNNSLVDVATNLRDILPAGWTFSNNVSGDFTFASQNGQVVSFNQITIPAGQSRSVQFDATSPADCLGPYENKAVADGSFSSPCLVEPATALSDTARATVTCLSKPCVSNVHCTAPEAACDGDLITVKGFATNCGDRAADITITINGHAHVLNNVGAGQEAEFDTSFAFACTAGQSTQWNVSATATNSCGTSAPGTSSCSTLCKSEPCVNNVLITAPAVACSNTPIQLKGFATNCGDRTEQIVITLSGPGGVIGSHAFNVAAGQVAEFDTTITLICTPGQGSQFTASAVASNDCGTSQPVQSAPATVQCLAGPCVDQVSCSTSASSLCDGSPLKLTGSAHNCSDRAEQIVITLLGPNDVVLAARAFNVDAGNSVSYDTTFTFNCTGTESKTYKASAVASNDCGTTDAVASSGCPVSCKTPPCVNNVSCSSPTQACDGDQIKLSGFATNCGDRTEEIVITLTGPGGAIGSHAFNVAAGAQATFDTTIVFHCSAGQNVNYSASAVASNDCGTTQPVSGTGCSVACAPAPCVTLQCAPGDTTVQVGDPYTVRVTATNCSAGAEDIKITVNGTDYSFTDVASSATVTVFLSQTCATEGAATYNASATATNSCGTTQPATCQSKVTCQGGLCCWLTMGGFLNGGFKSGGKDNTFGGNVGPPPSGSWEHIQRNGKTEVFNFHSHDAHVIACSNDGTAGPCHPKGDANVIDFGGTGAYSLNGGSRQFAATFTARAEDHGEPGNQPQHTGGCGTPDYYTITVKDAETGEVVFTCGALLDGGNIQIHDCKHASKTSAPNRGGGTLGTGSLSANGSGDGTSVDAAGSGISTLELYRPTPNPFSNTTSFAYQVSGSAAQRVQIGIYNVAGRLIRSLVDETKAPGQYQTVWNGQDMGGAQVTHGVYFIRAYVGGVRVDAASRILYLR